MRGEEVAEVSFEFTHEDEPTTLKSQNQILKSGEELPGAKLKVFDPEGNVVDEWTSGSRSTHHYGTGSWERNIH